MKFPRAIRLDESDAQVYQKSATPGEWTVPGSFTFLDQDPALLGGKERQAFAHGFLGTESFGWTTLVQVAEITQEDYAEVVRRLAAHFVERFGAPNLAAALPAAREEAEFAVSICEHQPNTLLTLSRDINQEGIVERFRVVHLNAADHEKVKLWGFVDDEEAAP